MQANATPEQQIVFYAREFVEAREAHLRAPPADKHDKRDVKHQKERALAQAVRSAFSGNQGR